DARPLGAAQVARADRVDQELDAVRLDYRVGGRVPFAFIDHQAVLEPRAAAALDEHPEDGLGLVFFLQQLADLRGCRLCHVDHSPLIIHWAVAQPIRYEPALRASDALLEHQAIARIWKRDVSVWGAEPGDGAGKSIANRLGWLDLPTSMRPELDRVESLAAGLAPDGIHVV